jgi:plastocyanin
MVQNDLFNPSSFTVATGSSVTWAWDSNGEPHSVTFNDQPIDSGIQTSGTFQHTFSTAGTFAYHCRVHANMTGTITVSASGSSGDNPPPSSGGGSGGGMGGGYGY